MFDKNILAPYFEPYRLPKKEEILTLIDLALDTKDEAWFKELRSQLDRF